ncbi:N-acetylneuraminate synthase [Rhizomicrobium palustre]|uniref:N-acetylneuraminate synthase n=1 Tax=Rhizomicrobium palustre TaxID=189966 RepID=A0A846MXW2_9PROT|nr:pseudaminic acid synthase [Rhizomicrobium palustre]NIK88065.1 N-acetylneuraminate synthase [Rhizomicrobium palustre]
MSRSISIAGRKIGPDHPPYVIAEMSGNHNGELKRALALLDAAKESGADAVKLQTYRADTITIDAYGPDFMVEGGLWDGRRLYELYEEAHTPWEWHADLFAHAKKIGLTIFSTPFDPTAIALLQSLDAPAYKIASSEIVDLPLIKQVAATGRPLIISTGMAVWDEIAEAVEAAKAGGASEIAVLHCVAAYPTPPEETNLSTIADLARKLDVVVGLSDHTMDTTISTIAVGLGANIIEKHFTLARADGGVDSAFSLEPHELHRLVRDVRIAKSAIGSPRYQPAPSEVKGLKYRRSLYVVADVKAGEVFTPENVRSIRPSFGLRPKFLDAVLGKKATRDVKRGEALAEEMIVGGL